MLFLPLCKIHHFFFPLETDYPPTANAKSEVVIYLPQNEVTLNGNLSTDDKGIKSWEWKKSPDTDKAVDMEVNNLISHIFL